MTLFAHEVSGWSDEYLVHQLALGSEAFQRNAWEVLLAEQSRRSLPEATVQRVAKRMKLEALERSDAKARISFGLTMIAVAVALAAGAYLLGYVVLWYGAFIAGISALAAGLRWLRDGRP